MVTAEDHRVSVMAIMSVTAGVSITTMMTIITTEKLL
jgi:hypothetical protein